MATEAAGQQKAVILLSGGLDSATCLLEARVRGFELNALSFRYGQKHEFELRAARRIGVRYGVQRHRFAEIDPALFQGSALTSREFDVPHGRESDFEEIPITYVPARNTVFLALALAWCEVLEAADLFIGVNAIDYSGYPDCRPEFIAAFERVANLGTKMAVEHRPIRIHTPLIQLSKAQIVQRGKELGLDPALTHSCYDPDSMGRACGTCPACRLRLRGFAECGLHDPAPYQAQS